MPASRLSILAILALLAVSCGPPQTAQVLAITNVSVINVNSGTQTPPVTVVTKSDQIAEIGEFIPIPPGAEQLDGTGQFLIPGLWDMQTYQELIGPDSIDLYLGNGIVGTRDMGSDADYILRSHQPW